MKLSMPLAQFYIKLCDVKVSLHVYGLVWRGNVCWHFIHLNGDVCLFLNGDILFLQGYSCRKENLHFNSKDSTMEFRLSENM
jgi:hypothetical protein